MLPNLSFLTCGILFCLVLFVLAGTGAMLPDARTRIGEMPEIGRPMMQQSIAEAPAPIQFYRVVVVRPGDEPERPRDVAVAGTVRPDFDPPAADPANPGLSQPDRPKPDQAGPDQTRPDVVADALPGLPGDNVEVPAQVPAAPAVAPAPVRQDPGPGEADPPRVAALALPAVESSGAAPRAVNAPLPPPRPALNASRRHRVLHRRYRLPQQDAAAQAVAPGSAAAVSPGPAAGYGPPVRPPAVR
jgi:hypothetical protein